MALNKDNPRLEQSDYKRFDHAYAMELKESWPQIWKAGGNQRGNEAYAYWHRYTEGDRSDSVLSWVKEREAWAARHYQDGKQFNEGEEPTLSSIAGVIAQVKWGVVGNLGMSKMKSVIKTVKDKLNEKQEQSKFQSIPQSACIMSLGEFEYEDNGDNAKSAPVRLKARSGKPIEHSYWGKVVHDFAGMRLNKNRISIDYVHDSKEVIGYLNRFDIESGDLFASGALVPYKESDRASEIIYKMKQGVPYEASINFGGDGIELEELMEGQQATVNGHELSGPAVIVRSWPLRNVAVCPLGADMYTETSALFTEGKTYAATVRPQEQHKESIMEDKDTEAVELTADTEVAESNSEVQSDCETCGGTPRDETQQSAMEIKLEPRSLSESAVETAETEAAPAVEVNAKEAMKKLELSSEQRAAVEDELRQRFADMIKEYGLDVASTVYLSGGNEVDALKLSLQNAKSEVDELRKQAEVKRGGRASAFASTESKKVNLFTK